MPNVTVTSLVDQVLVLSDRRDQVANAGHVTRASVLQWLNVALGALERELLRAGVTYREEVATLTCDGSTSYLFEDLTDGPTESEPMAVLAVFKNDGSKLPPASMMKNFRAYLYTSSGSAPLFFRCKVGTGANNGKQTIQLWPTPSSGVYKVHYVPRPTPLFESDATGDGVTSVMLPVGLEQFLVLFAARMAYSTEETINPMTNELYAEAKGWLSDYANSFLAMDPPVIQDRDGEGYSERDEWTVSPEFFVWL